MRKVAILCAAKNSIYKQIDGCDVYDIERDARTFPGGMPVVAHPPCRLWSAFCAHQAKANDPEAEKALGLWCAEQVKRWGGVLEQPAHSRLWDAAKLPGPGRAASSTENQLRQWSLELPQFWFGDPREKNTWLFFSGVEIPEMPFRLKPEGGDRRIWQLMSSKNQRERTPKAFAEWLVRCAKSVYETTQANQPHL